MAVTRIKNNQITDSTITFQKIATGTLVGSLFNANLTLNSNVSITGNLSVAGNTTTVNSIDTTVNDSIIVFNSGYVGVPSYDIGFVADRGLGTLGTYGSVNAALVWSESDGAFIAVLTTETGGTHGQINRAFKANLIVGNLTVANAVTAQKATITTLTATNTNLSGLTSTGNIVAASGQNATSYTTGALVVPGGGGVGITGDLWVQGPSTFAGNIIAGNIQLSGNINVPVGGTFSNTGVFFGNAGGIGALYAGTSTYTALPTTVLQLSANINTYAQLNFQNINAGANASTDFVLTADNGNDNDGYLNLGIDSSSYNNPSFPGFFPNDGYLIHHSATSTGNLIIFSHTEGSAIKLHVGEYGAANVKVTVTNNGLRVNTATASTSTTSGALLVDGGAGIVGNLYIGGAIFSASGALGTFAAINNTPIGNATPSTGSFTDLSSTTLATTNFSTANARITGGYADSFPIGANTAAPGTFTFANATTLFAGTGTVATLNSTTGNITTLTSTTVNAGTATTATLNVTTANLTSANSTTLVATNFSTANARISGGYADNFPIGANTKATGAFTTLTSNGLTTFTDATQSDNPSTGAVVITGGLGIGANLNVAGNVTITGNITVLGNSTVLNTETLNVEDLNITVAANATTGAEANGAGLTVAGANATFTYLNADDSWNLNKKLNATTIGAATINVTNGNIVNVDSTNINASVTTSATVNSTNGNITTLVTNNFSTGNARITGGYADNFPIGANTASTGNFTTANATTINASTTNTTTLNATNGNITTLVATNFSTANARITGGYADSFPIGANTAAPGTFTFANATTLFADTGTIGTVNSTTGNITTLTSTTINAGTTTTATLNSTNGNITTLQAGTTTSATLNATTGNITTLVATNFSTANARITGGYADNFPIGANTAAPGTFTSLAAATATIGGLQAQAIGNITPGTGDFTLLTTSSTFISSGNIIAGSGTTSVSTTTGALVVVGGAGMSGNINIGGRAVINNSQTLFDTIIRGYNEQSLLNVVSDSVYDQVTIGGNLVAANVVQGAKLQINSTDSLIIPVGTTAQRPSGRGFTDVDGMLRYNQTLNTLEYYGNGQWYAPSQTFTVITSRTFSNSSGDIYGNVDGTNLNFTLSNASTTSSTVVSINGVVQAPVTAYTVSGSTLTFTEAPAVGDVIDTRVLTTTTTVTTIASPDGFNQFIASNVGLSFYTGNILLGTVENWRLNLYGDLLPLTTSNIGGTANYVDYVFVSNVEQNGSTNTDDTVHYVGPSATDSLANFDKTIYRSAKIFVQLSNSAGGTYQAIDAYVIHDGTNAFVTYSGNVKTSGELATFAANVSGNMVYLNATSAGANLAVKAHKTLMKL